MKVRVRTAGGVHVHVYAHTESERWMKEETEERKVDCGSERSMLVKGGRRESELGGSHGAAKRAKVMRLA